MERPFFSITTPCFNSVKTIEQTLKSVLIQEFKDYEYIIIDGGSNDGTIDVIKRYEPQFEGRMHWISEPDKGIYDAFNKGAKLSKGIYCWNVNADDFMEKNALAEIASMVAKKEEKDFPIISASSNYIYTDGKVAYTKSMTAEESERRYKLADIGINHPATLIPKYIYEKIGYYDDKYKIMGDMDWFRRAYEAHLPFLFLDITITNMTEGGVSTNLNFGQLAKDRWHYSCKFYANFFIRTYVFFKWMLMLLKGHMKYVLVKKGLMKK